MIYLRNRFLPVLALALVAGASFADDAFDTTRALLERWVETRKAIATEKRDWKLAKEMLEDRAELVRGEIAAVEAKIAETERGVGEADKVRAALVAEADALKLEGDVLAGTVATLEARTRTLLARLPAPIREKVKPLSARLPEDPATTALPPSVRFQNVVGILNEINKFAREILITSEIRELPGGRSVEVTAVYLGIGQGYYVGAGNTVAGIGTAGKDAWEWTPADASAEAIARTVAILKNERPAEYVALPVKID
jgi:septal ring factor EnvC (AmiA/AmiB activator)